MDKIEIYWGADKDFEEATGKLEDVHFLVDVVNHINKTDLKIEGVGGQKDPPTYRNPMIFIRTFNFDTIKSTRNNIRK